jgi:DNA-binding response OmpR family regulator
MQGSQNKILVVDDVAANRELLSRYFGARGFQVAEADCGSTALSMIKQERFNAVLLDILMPEIDGIEVLKRIRAQWAKDSLPVIMVSALNAQRDVKLALEIGANDYVSKPVDLPGALAKLQRAIDSQKQTTGVGSLHGVKDPGSVRSRKEMRRKPRRQVQGIAWILAEQHGPPTQCVVADVTPLGACLVLQKDRQLRNHFRLLLSENLWKDCRVVWRSGLKIGIEFSEGMSDKPRLETGALIDRLL